MDLRYKQEANETLKIKKMMENLYLVVEKCEREINYLKEEDQKVKEEIDHLKELIEENNKKYNELLNEKENKINQKIEELKNNMEKMIKDKDSDLNNKITEFLKNAKKGNEDDENGNLYKAPLSSKTYLDLLDLILECPSKGALKNFAVRTEEKNVWYQFGCYSFLTASNEFDESILKGIYLIQSVTFKYKSTDSLESLTKVDFKCPSDYALNKFTLTKDCNSYLVVDYACVGVKSSSQTKLNTVGSGTSEGSPMTVSTLSGLT